MLRFWWLVLRIKMAIGGLGVFVLGLIMIYLVWNGPTSDTDVNFRLYAVGGILAVGGFLGAVLCIVNLWEDGI